MLVLAIAVLIVLLGSALCSGSEAALFSLPPVKARQLAEAGVSGGGALYKIRLKMQRPIATIVILNNVFNIVGSIVVGGIAAELFDSRGLGIFSAVLTFLVILFAEIIPKTMGERFAEPVALTVARPLLGLTYLFFPLVWLIEKSLAPLARPDALPTTDEAEIKLLARIGHQEGVINRDESEIIHQVFRLNDETAGDLMTPREVVDALVGSVTLREAREAIVGASHSRILVIGENLDDYQGVVLKQDLLRGLALGELEHRIDDYAVAVRPVGAHEPADVLLRRFQKHQSHLSPVVNYAGRVVGVLSLEDVLEVLTGEINDEADQRHGRDARPD